MQSVVIGGASTGIGQATAKLLLARGFRVFGSVRKQIDAGIDPASGRRGQIHCVFMTFPLRFYDTSQAPAASFVSWSSPAKAH